MLVEKVALDDAQESQLQLFTISVIVISACVVIWDSWASSRATFSTNICFPSRASNICFPTSWPTFAQRAPSANSMSLPMMVPIFSKSFTCTELPPTCPDLVTSPSASSQTEETSTSQFVCFTVTTLPSLFLYSPLMSAQLTLPGW